MVQTAEEKKAKRKARYQKKKKEKMSATMIQKAVKAYLAKPRPKRKPKKIYKTTKDGEIAKSMMAYHSCCKSAKCGKKYNK